MKKIFLASLLFATLASAWVSCIKSKQHEAISTAQTNDTVSYTVAQNYFVRGDVTLPIPNHRIASQAELDSLFGMATTMGENGKPTPIDFEKQFALAVIQPPTDRYANIVPQSLITRNDTLTLTYKVKIGDSLGYKIQPMLLLVVDKQFDCPTVVVEQGE